MPLSLAAPPWRFGWTCPPSPLVLVPLSLAAPPWRFGWTGSPAGLQSHDWWRQPIGCPRPVAGRPLAACVALPWLPGGSPGSPDVRRQPLGCQRTPPARRQPSGCPRAGAVALCASCRLNALSVCGAQVGRLIGRIWPTVAPGPLAEPACWPSTQQPSGGCPLVADANPNRAGCPLAANAVHSTEAARWPSRCWVDMWCAWRGALCSCGVFWPYLRGAGCPVAAETPRFAVARCLAAQIRLRPLAHYAPCLHCRPG